MKPYPLARPYIGKPEIQAVKQVLQSGHLSLGPMLKKFEQAFAKKLGTPYAVAVSSGTAGLHLALLASGLKKGDEVITTPFSFVASANSILYVGAKPVFVDIDPITYNLNPAEIETKITKRTKAILPVHIFGQAVEMDSIIKMAKAYKLKIIEDACESIGATYKGKKVGTFGEAAVFAFYPNKQITTGEGGMIITSSKKIARLCASLRNQGRADDLQWLDHQYLGYNYRLDEMSASLGFWQLKKLDWLIKQRQKLAALYTKSFASYADLISVPQIAQGNTHSWFVYVVKIQEPKINRDKVVKLLYADGIETKPYLPSIHLFEFYRQKFGYRKGDFPHAEKASSYCLALPFYIGLAEEDIGSIVKKLIKTLKRAYDQDFRR